MVWLELLFGIVFELYAMQVFTILQLAKLSLNNTKWTLKTIGHFCEEGRLIDSAVHPVKSKICYGWPMQKVIYFLGEAQGFHRGLISDL